LWRDGLNEAPHSGWNGGVPGNMPAIGDLFDLFDFGRKSR
jgi:hypothetical protein